MIKFEGWEDILYMHFKLIDEGIAEDFCWLVRNEYPFFHDDMVPSPEIEMMLRKLNNLMGRYRTRCKFRDLNHINNRDYLLQGKVDNTSED